MRSRKAVALADYSFVYVPRFDHADDEVQTSLMDLLGSDTFDDAIVLSEWVGDLVAGDVVRTECGDPSPAPAG